MHKHSHPELLNKIIKVPVIKIAPPRIWGDQNTDETTPTTNYSHHHLLACQKTQACSQPP